MDNFVSYFEDQVSGFPKSPEFIRIHEFGVINSFILEGILSPARNRWISGAEPLFSLDADQIQSPLRTRNQNVVIHLALTPALRIRVRAISGPNCLAPDHLLKLTAISSQTAMLNSRVPVHRHRMLVPFWDS